MNAPATSVTAEIGLGLPSATAVTCAPGMGARVRSIATPFTVTAVAAGAWMGDRGGGENGQGGATGNDQGGQKHERAHQELQFLAPVGFAL